MGKKRRLRTLADVQKRYKDQNPIIIDCWDHLKDWYEKHGPSKTHRLEFSHYAASIRPLVETDKWEEYTYLSTHTFYGKGAWLMSTEMLNRANFKGIIIRNQDAKEDNEIWPEWTWVLKEDTRTWD